MSLGEFVFLPAYRLPLPQGFLTAPTEFLTGSCRNELFLPAYRCRNYNYAWFYLVVALFRPPAATHASQDPTNSVNGFYSGGIRIQA